MPVKKVQRKVAKKNVVKLKVVSKKSARTDVSKMVLPDDVSEISENLSDYTWMLYGERKIGKTSLFSQFGRPFYFMFDPKNKGLRLLQVYIPSWEHANKGIELLEQKLEANPKYCNLVVVDTGFMCYERCYQYMIKGMNLDTAHGQNDRGVAWKEISREFMEWHDKIYALCDKYELGFAVIAHAELMKDLKRKDGTTYDKLTTQLGGQAFKYYNGALDIIAFYHYNRKDERMLTISGTAKLEAGARIEDHFKYTNGKPIKDIPMSKSPKLAYANLLKAFNNELVEPSAKGVKKTARKKR
jgi:hypothetical protein